MTTSNPFFEDWALDAAVEHLASPSQAVETVSAGDCGSSGALLPLTRRLSAPAGIGPVWAVWDHIHCFDTTPAGNIDAATVLDPVFDFLAGKRASMLHWSGLPTDTPFYEDLVAYLERAKLEFEVTRTRFRPVLSADDGLESERFSARLASKRMGELRRRRRQLQEKGSLGFQVHGGQHDADIWMRSFLDLEASGWKRARGTAIACRPNERAFFERLSRDAAAQGKVLVCSLELDGCPVAMTVNLRLGSRIWGFKTAYADDFARFSPGVLVLCETTAHALREPSIAWLDSCMEHEEGPPGMLWHGRRQIVDLLISTKRSNNWLPAAAKLALGALRVARSRIGFSATRAPGAPRFRPS